MINKTTDIEHITTRAHFATFVRGLLRDLREDPASWENQTLESYLDALAAWTDDMDGYFSYRGGSVPEQPSWKLLAQMLAAAKVYE